MQCKCGAETKESSAVDKKADLKWVFITCKSCGFIDKDELYDYSGQNRIAVGYEARKTFTEKTS